MDDEKFITLLIGLMITLLAIAFVLWNITAGW